MSPARAILRVAGYEMMDADLPEQVTEACEI
jgi:transcription termination factor NusB